MAATSAMSRRTGKPGANIQRTGRIPTTRNTRPLRLLRPSPEIAAISTATGIVSFCGRSHVVIALVRLNASNGVIQSRIRRGRPLSSAIHCCGHASSRALRLGSVRQSRWVRPPFHGKNTPCRALAVLHSSICGLCCCFCRRGVTRLQLTRLCHLTPHMATSGCGIILIIDQENHAQHLPMPIRTWMS